MFEVKGRVSLDGSGVNRTLGNLRRGIGSWAGGLKSQLAGAFTVGAIGVAAKKVIDFGGKINDLSIRTGVSTKTLQQWNYAAEQNSATLDDVTRAWGAFGRARNEALKNPAGEQMDAFQALGLDETALRDNPLQKSFEQAIETVRTTDFGANTEGIVAKVFGKGGGELLATFKNDFASVREEMERLGLYIDDKGIKSLDELGDAFNRLKTQLRGPFTQAIVQVAAWVGVLINGIERLIGGIGWGLGKLWADIESGKFSNPLRTFGEAWNEFQNDFDKRLKAMEKSADGTDKRISKMNFRPDMQSSELKDKMLKLEMSLLDATQKRERLEAMIAKHIEKAQESKAAQKRLDYAIEQRKQVQKAIDDLAPKVANLDDARKERQRLVEETGNRVFAAAEPKPEPGVVDKVMGGFVETFSPQIVRQTIDKIWGMMTGQGNLPGGMDEGSMKQLQEKIEQLVAIEKQLTAGTPVETTINLLKKTLSDIEQDITKRQEAVGTPNEELAKAIDLAMQIPKDEKEAKQDTFTPISDELSRIGGFTGASGSPQEGIKREIQTGNKTQADVLQQIRTLVGDVQAMKTRLENP